MRIRSNHWINRQRDMVNGVQSCELDLTVPESVYFNIGCMSKDKETILHLHNDSQYMTGIMISRG